MTSVSCRFALATLLGLFIPTAIKAQAEYRNLEGGRPVRISDASPTERNALELDLTTVRVDRLSLGRYRLQVEPRISYGILPRTDIAIRALGYYREPSAVPRGTVAGIGLGGEYQLRMESLHLPALGIATEAFFPTGPNAARVAYSVKGLLTRSFPIGRIHLNASYGSFSIKIPAPPPGGVTLIPPVIDGPCIVQPGGGPLIARAMCTPGSNLATAGPASSASAAPLRPGINTGRRWLAGIAADKAFPLKSILIVADLFAERFEGIGRPTDWTAELGGRTQLTPRIVADLGAGRHFSGVSPSWFATFGTTVSFPFQLGKPQ